MRVYCLLLLLCAPAGAEVKVWFDARAPHARPMAGISLEGRRGMALLDTGATGTFLGTRWARLGPKPLAPLGLDYSHRPFLGFRSDAKVILDGLGLLEPPLWVSDWAEHEERRRPGGPHIDAVVAPQLLGGTDAVLIDFTRAALERLPWGTGLDKLSWLPVPLCDVPAGADLKFVVDASVRREAMRLVIDTGAPQSLLYVPRGDDLPPKAVRAGTRHGRLSVGRVETELTFEVLEPLPPVSPYDGVIGMDVLRDCALLMTRDRLVGRCRAQP